MGYETSVTCSCFFSPSFFLSFFLFEFAIGTYSGHVPATQFSVQIRCRLNYGHSNIQEEEDKKCSHQPGIVDPSWVSHLNNPRPGSVQNLSKHSSNINKLYMPARRKERLMIFTSINPSKEQETRNWPSGENRAHSAWLFVPNYSNKIINQWEYQLKVKESITLENL